MSRTGEVIFEKEKLQKVSNAMADLTETREMRSLSIGSEPDMIGLYYTILDIVGYRIQRRLTQGRKFPKRVDTTA